MGRRLRMPPGQPRLTEFNAHRIWWARWRIGKLNANREWQHGYQIALIPWTPPAVQLSNSCRISCFVVVRIIRVFMLPDCLSTFPQLRGVSLGKRKRVCDACARVYVLVRVCTFVYVWMCVHEYSNASYSSSLLNKENGRTRLCVRACFTLIFQCRGLVAAELSSVGGWESRGRALRPRRWFVYSCLCMYVFI